jgi:hypothetical protein
VLYRSGQIQEGWSVCRGCSDLCAGVHRSIVCADCAFTCVSNLLFQGIVSDSMGGNIEGTLLTSRRSRCQEDIGPEPNRRVSRGLVRLEPEERRERNSRTPFFSVSPAAQQPAFRSGNGGTSAREQAGQDALTRRQFLWLTLPDRIQSPGLPYTPRPSSFVGRRLLSQ